METQQYIQPFIGVCGIQTIVELAHLDRMGKLFAGTPYFIMAGIKDVSVTLPAYRSNIVRPFLHCDHYPHRDFEAWIDKIVHKCRHVVRGLQLNMLPWMDHNYAPMLYRIRQRYPHLALILQADRQTMERHTPHAIAKRLHGATVDYILFDSSQSRGIPYDITIMQKYVAAIYEHQLPIGVVVAGGLHAESIPSAVLPLAAAYPYLSCDAFARLYDVSGKRIDIAAADRYLFAAARCIVDRYRLQASYVCAK